MPRLPLVVARGPVPAGAYDPLAGAAELRLVDAAEPWPALVQALEPARAFISLLTDPVDAALLDAAPALEVVANYAVGVDNIDLQAARTRGIWVTNTPGVLTEATAELTIGLVIMLARRLGEAERELRAGRFGSWTPTYLLGEGLNGKTLGVVGLGRIGRAVAVRARALGMRIVHTDRGATTGPELPDATALGLDELLATSDVVSLHVPLTPDTRHLVGERQLAGMKPTAFLVNTSRGPVVDEAALARALHAGTIAGAALDVYEDEPRVHPDLLTAPRAVLLPHVGSNSREARVAMGRLAARNVAAVLAGREPETPVVRGRPLERPSR